MLDKYRSLKQPRSLSAIALSAVVLVSKLLYIIIVSMFDRLNTNQDLQSFSIEWDKYYPTLGFL
jgi:hypothetical protein